MFRKKQKPEVVEQPASENTEFKKNIKTLWVYTSLFCTFALVLILVSSIIQGKVDDRAEDLQDQIESERTTSQSTIQNIQTKNDALTKENEKLKEQNEFLKSQAETEKTLLDTANEIITNAEYLAKALAAEDSETARVYIAKIDPSRLSTELFAEYSRLITELGA